MVKVSADLSYVLNPHQLLILLSGLNSDTYSQILLPDAIQRIGFMGYPLGPNPNPFEYDLMASTRPFKIDIGFDKLTGQNGPIMNNNFEAALQLLQKSIKEGMVELFDTSKYAKIGRNIYNIDKNMSSMLEHRWDRKGGGYLFISTMSGEEIPALLGLYQEENVIPFFSERSSLQNNFARDLPAIFGQNEILGKYIDSIIECPVPANVDEMFFYAKNIFTVNHVMNKMIEFRDNQVRTKDVTLIGAKYVGTTAIDISMFGGLPISSGLVAAYDIVRRYFKQEENTKISMIKKTL